MKLLICADVRLGAACTENLGADLSHKWQAARTGKLSGLADKAIQEHAAYIVLLGRIFGQERVSESIIDDLFGAVREAGKIQAFAVLAEGEYDRITYRNDIPENLHLICAQKEDSYADGNLAIRIHGQDVEIRVADRTPIQIVKSEGRFKISGLGEERAIPFFEPLGFEDAAEHSFGYELLDWGQDARGRLEVKESQTYAYRSIEIKILPEDGRKEILRKINTAVSGMDFDTMLRVTIAGRLAFGRMLNGDELKAHLQNKIFFAEVYDNTIMDIDEEAFEHDISLRSEFVRLALRDDFLSESERNWIICHGWNALNGEEVSAE